MTSPTLDVHKLPAAFGLARGVKADQDWAELVIGRMYLENINHTLVHAELTQVLALVRDSGESPQDLFGDPFDYVDAQIQQWRTEGAPVLPVEPPTSWRDVPVLAASIATFTIAMFGVLELFSGNWTTDYTLGKLLAPALIGTTALVSLTTFETRLQHIRRLWAVVLALLPALLGITLTASLFVLGNTTPLFTGPLWWYAVLTVGHALVTIGLYRYFSDAQAHRTLHHSLRSTLSRQGATTQTEHKAAPTAQTDDQWALELAGLLRLRIEMPEKEVRATVVEARQHARNNNTTLSEEFGAPNDYASRLPRSTSGRRVRERWRRIAWIIALPAFGYLAFEGLQHGWAWSNVRWIMAIAFTAACFTVIGFLRHRTSH